MSSPTAPAPWRRSPTTWRHARAAGGSRPGALHPRSSSTDRGCSRQRRHPGQRGADAASAARHPGRRGGGAAGNSRSRRGRRRGASRQGDRPRRQLIRLARRGGRSTRLPVHDRAGRGARARALPRGRLSLVDALVMRHGSRDARARSLPAGSAAAIPGVLAHRFRDFGAGARARSAPGLLREGLDLGAPTCSSSTPTRSCTCTAGAPRGDADVYRIPQRNGGLLPPTCGLRASLGGRFVGATPAASATGARQLPHHPRVEDRRRRRAAQFERDRRLLERAAAREQRARCLPRRDPAHLGEWRALVCIAGGSPPAAGRRRSGTRTTPSA